MQFIHDQEPVPYMLLQQREGHKPLVLKGCDPLIIVFAVKGGKKPDRPRFLSGRETGVTVKEGIAVRGEK